MTAAARVAVAPATAAPTTSAPTARDVAGQLAAAFAVVAGAGGLSHLILDDAWWRAVIVPVAVVALIGVVGRVARASWWLVLPLQLLALPFAVSAVSGVWVVQHLLELRTALAAISVAVPPIEDGSGLAVLLGLAFGAVAIVVDSLVRTVPAVAGVPILAVVVTTLTISELPVPTAAVLLPAAGYLLVLVLTAPVPVLGTRLTRVRAGVGGLCAAALLGGAALGAGALLPRTAPDLSTAGLLSRVDVSSGRIGAAPMTELTGELLRDEAVPILALSAREDSQWESDYLRGAVLTEYVPGVGWEGGSLSVGQERSAGSSDQVVEISSLAYAGWFLPVPDGTVRVLEPEDVWSYDPGLGIWHGERALDPGRYVVAVDPARPTTTQLASDTVDPSPDEIAFEGVDPAVVALAQELTGAATSPWERAVALQQFFLDPASGFTYSLTVPTGATGDLLVDFLTDRQGFCEQFASTMAVMARAVGLPARVVVGYGPGSSSDGVTTITSHDAHAWVEIRFEDAGWVRFDPTPPDGTHQRIQGYAVPAPEPEPGEEETTASPTPTGTSAPGPVNPDAPDFADEDAVPDPGGAGSGGGAGGGSAGWWWLAVAVVVLLVVAAVAPRAERARRRRARRARVRAGDPGAGWEEVEALARDHGVALPPDASVRTAAAVLGRQIRLDERARWALTVLVRGAERGWYADRADAVVVAGPGGVPERSGGPADADVERAIGVVHVALVRAHPRSARARWFPRSLVPRRGGLA